MAPPAQAPFRRSWSPFKLVLDDGSICLHLTVPSVVNCHASVAFQAWLSRPQLLENGQNPFLTRG